MNTKVTIPCRTIRKLAWSMGKDNYWSCVLIALCCRVLERAPYFIFSSFTNNDVLLTLVNAVGYVVQVVLTLGLAHLFIEVFRGKSPSLELFTEVFPSTLMAVMTDIISFFQVFWRLFLLVIPGVIKAIENVFSLHVLSDNPGYSPMQCIERSNQIMQGNRGKFFKLLLSFILLFVLSAMPSSFYMASRMPASVYMLDPAMGYQQLVEALESQNAIIAALSGDPVYIVLSALTVLAEVYMMMSIAAFYDLASGNIVLAENGEL